MSAYIQIVIGGRTTARASLFKAVFLISFSRDEWKLLSQEIAKHVPLFDNCNMIDALATCVHQVRSRPGLRYFLVLAIIRSNKSY